jgi:glucokinase
MSFGAAEADEEDVFSRLRDQHGTVSAECILSGPGIVRLHHALHPGVAPLTSHDIIARTKAGDEAARTTVNLFVRLLGRFAGDVALVFKATGALYLTGGVSCGLGPLIDSREFRRAFEAHRPYERLLAGIPTFLITEAEPGLVGCAVIAETMLRERGLDAAASA